MEMSSKDRKRRRQTLWPRFQTMARIGWHLMTFNGLRLMATLLGVVFATILANQAIGTLFGLMQKFVALERYSGADIWIVPKGTKVLQGGKTISMSTVLAARSHSGVAQSMPMLLTGGSIKLPNGGAEPLQIVGTVGPDYLAGPWNLLQGSAELLESGSTIILEDSERENLGSVNLGSQREINGMLTTVVGFTYGMSAIGGGAYAFAGYEFTRELANMPNDRTNFGLVKVRQGFDAAKVRAELEDLLPEATVVTKEELDATMIGELLRVTPIGITFSAIAAFGVVIGFVIVSLSIFSAVSDNLREFGTLKAVGARGIDLGLILFAQSIAFGVIGSILGLGAVSLMAQALNSGKLLISIQPWMIGTSIALMTAMCCTASLFSLIRLWRVEPGMVFR